MPKIIFIKMTHTTEEMNTAIVKLRGGSLPEDLVPKFETMAESQFQVMKYLRKHPKVPVTYENNSVIKKNDQIARLLAEAFKDGIPDKFSKCTELQKKYLVYYGGVSVAVNTGIIPQTYSDNTYYIKNENDFLDKFNVKDYMKLHDVTARVNQGRDYLSLENDICVAKNLNSEEIIHVAGGLHSYNDVASCFPNVQIKTVDLTFLKSSDKWGKGLISLMARDQNFRSTADCDGIAHIVSKFPTTNDRCLLSSSTTTNTEQLQFNSYNVGTIALVSVLAYGAFGLFKHCLKSRNEEVNNNALNKNKEVKKLKND